MRKPTLALVILFLLPQVAGGSVVIIPLDTCSFEALRYAKERGWLEHEIVMPANVTWFDPTRKYAMISAYTPEPEMERVMRGLLGDSRLFASSNTLGIGSERAVRSELLRRFCERGDERALKAAVEPLSVGREALSMLSLTIFLLLAAVLGAALGVAALTYREVIPRLAELGAPIAVLFMKLRRRGVLTREEVETHPLRMAILEALKHSPQSFSELQRRTGVGRAVLEWHIGILKAYGLIVERKVSKSRVYSLSD